MRSAIILSGLFSLTFAQSSASQSTSATTTAPLTPQASCLSKCAAGDVNCQAICVGVPHPGSAQTNATTDCVAKCDQGDGSTAASQAYSKCRDACISSYIITMPGNTAAPGGEYTTPAIPGVATTMSTAVANANAAVSGSSTWKSMLRDQKCSILTFVQTAHRRPLPPVPLRQLNQLDLLPLFSSPLLVASSASPWLLSLGCRMDVATETAKFLYIFCGVSGVMQSLAGDDTAIFEDALSPYFDPILLIISRCAARSRFVSLSGAMLLRSPTTSLAVKGSVSRCITRVNSRLPFPK